MISSGGGVGYEKMILEAAGDFAETAFAAEVCRVDIFRVGRGVASFMPWRVQEKLDNATIPKKA